MHVDELFASVTSPQQVTDKQWLFPSLLIHESWAQGRTAFGGISAGMVYHAIRQCCANDRVLRSFTTNFIGPLALNTPFELKVTLLRSGQNVSQFLGEIIQDGKTCVFSQACFGVGRQSAVSVANTEKHTMPAPEKAKFIPQIPKVTPKFLRHFDLSIDEGGIPFTRRKTSVYNGFMRFKNAPESITDAHLITLIDAWPPTLLQMMRWPAPASTVSWNLEFIHPHKAVNPEDWFAYRAHTRQAADGYGHTEATIWDANNDVVAISRQTVAIFD